MSNLRALAQGRDCQGHIPQACNANPETTVLAHFRVIGISGMGIKSPDIIAAWLCSGCHAWVDTHKDPETQLAFAKAVFRTQYILVQEKEVKW